MKRSKAKPIDLRSKRADIVALEEQIARLKRAGDELERATKGAHRCPSSFGCKAWDCDNLS